MSQPARSGWSRAWLLLGAALGVLVLPWYFPPPGPVVAESYVLGFSNQLAVLAVLASLTVAVWLRLRAGEREPWFASSPAGAGSATWSGDRRLLVAILLGYVLLVLVAHLAIDGSDFAESGYFQRRLRAVLDGARPWADVEFVYGPLLLVPQLILVRFGMAPRLAYDLAFLVALAGGFLLLAWLLPVHGIPARARRYVLLAIAAASFDLATGINYTLTRFLAPLAMVVLAVPWLRTAVVGPLLGWILVTATATAAAAGLGAALSPEVGVAGAVAALAAAAGAGWGNTRRLAIGGLVATASLAAVAAALPADYLAGFVAFAAGAHHLPLWPTPHLLLLLGSLLLVIPRLASTVFAAVDVADGASERPRRLAELAYVVALLPGALGRADATHALYYGLLPLAWALLLVAREWPRRYAWALGAFVAVFVVGAQGMTLWLGRSLYAGELWRTLAPRVATVDSDRLRALGGALGLPAEKIERALARGAARGLPPALVGPVNDCLRVATPLGVDEHVEADLRFRRRLAALYFVDDLNLVTPAHLDRHLADLAAADCVLVEELEMAAPRGTYGGDARATAGFLSQRLLFPVWYQPVREPFRPRREVAAVLARDFTPVAQAQGWLLLRRRAGGLPPAE